MKHLRRTEIELETHEVTIIRTRRRRTGFCEFCRANVWMLAPETAAVLIQSSPRSIFRRIEAGDLHFLELPDGALLVCCRSLEISPTAQAGDLL